MHLLLTLIITLLTCLDTVSSFPFTPFICDMNVAVLRHNNQTTTGLPTTTSERNVVSLSSPVVAPGGSITVTLSSISGIPSIYGFLIYARDSQNNHVGTMMGNSNSSPCNNLVNAGTTQGHNNAQVKDQLTFTWTAPTQPGAYLITCIVTEVTGLTPFIIVPSKIVTVQNGAPAPATPAPTTPPTPAHPATTVPLATPAPPAATIPPPPPITPATTTPPVTSTGGVHPPRISSSSSSSSTGGARTNTTRIVFVRQIRARILAFIPSIKSFVQRLEKQLAKVLKTDPRNIILTHLVRDTNQTVTPTSNAVKQSYLQTYSSGKGRGIGIGVGIGFSEDDDEGGGRDKGIPSFYLIGLAFLQPVDATNFKLALVKLASVDGQISAQSALAQDTDTVQLEYDTQNGLDEDGNVAIESATLQLTTCPDGTTVAVAMVDALCATENNVSSSSTSVNKGLAIGVTIAGVVLLAMIIGGAVYYQKRSKATKSTVTPRL